MSELFIHAEAEESYQRGYEEGHHDGYNQAMTEIPEISEIPVDYDSPIQIVTEMAESVAKFVDDGVMKAVVKAGFNIDKDKLVSILRQDRERYEAAYRKGYADGYKKREDELVRCKDCKHFGRYYCDSKKGVCEKLNIIGRSEEWFCADGERKEQTDG